MSATSGGFYAGLAPFAAFGAVTDPSVYAALPADWVVGLADVVHSTAAIAEGRYKAVNTVGAAVIAAVTNALPSRPFPFSLGGDGASLAVPGEHIAPLREVLGKTAAWAEDSLGLALRVGMAPVHAVRDAGFDVRVARYAASPNVTYGMFSGGGMSWAEARLKDGDFPLPRGRRGEEPDLHGLFCSFLPIVARRGTVLSLIAVPVGHDPGFADLVDDILDLLRENGHSGRPLPESGPLGAFVVPHALPTVLTRARNQVRDACSRLLHRIGVPPRSHVPAPTRRQHGLSANSMTRCA